MTMGELMTEGVVTQKVADLGINGWQDLVSWVRALPYGRNKQRGNPLLVLEERKGSCSTKHALLKLFAEENGFLDIKLMVGIYKMNPQNTPEVKDVLLSCGLAYLPEAHCYLKKGEQRIDATKPHFDIAQFEQDILEEIEINVEQIADYKVSMHRHFLKKWLKENAISLEFQQVWEIREKCIEKLVENQPLNLQP